MTSSVAIGYTNYILTSSLFNSSAEFGFDVNTWKNQSGNSTDCWQTAAAVTTASASLVTPDGLPLIFRIFSIHRSNLTTAARLRYVGYSDAAGTIQVYDSGEITGIASGFGQHVHIAPADFQAQKIIMYVYDNSNPDGFVRISLAYWGKKFSPTISYTPQSNSSRSVGTSRIVTRSGGISWQRYFTARVWTMNFQGITEAETWSDLQELDEVCRDGRNILFVPDTTDSNIHKASVFGLMEPSSGLGYLGNTKNARTWSTVVTERL